jgi:nitrogen fixation-related uncharacterized protein
MNKLTGPAILIGVSIGALVTGLFVAALLWAMAPSQEERATRSAIMEAASNPDTLYIIHAPAAGCPQGWMPLPKAFFEGDGATHDACVRGTGHQGAAMDYLLPGESFPGIADIESLNGPKEGT